MTTPTDTKTTPSRGSDPVEMLDQLLRRAIAAAVDDPALDTNPRIAPSQRPDHGDFQANAAMGLAKQLGTNPRELAQKIVDHADLSSIAEPPEVAGPGFINIRLKTEALGALLDAMDDSGLGVEPVDTPFSVVIDLCGVNVSKQMHVGHLRSTIIGDALARVFERQQRTVYRENHLGDWGLPIAMVLDRLRRDGADLDALDLTDLDNAYRDAQLASKSDLRGLAAALALHAGPHRIAELEEQTAGAADALESAKSTLVALQRGDEDLVRDWKRLIACTLGALDESLAIMGVELGPENHHGESFYRGHLTGVIDAFETAGLSAEDAGALVVRFEDRERPLLIRKSDGGFLYATTDLAALRYRVGELDPDRIIYIVDARQRDHFRDVFDAFRLIGWNRTSAGSEVELIHKGFGAVLGEDKKPLKTRSGENVTLESLLDEACERGTREVAGRAEDPNAPTHGLAESELREIGRAVGIGAIKYADLSNDLVRDYVFSFERMITFEGNTGPYLQYAHARICSIFGKAESDLGLTRDAFDHAAFLVSAPEEKQLALTLLRYGAIVASVADSLEPHRLCNYLYELANAYSAFYQNCSVLKADREDVRLSRLRLCDLSRRVLADGLSLLGIDSPTRM